jgi:hypothetical protein
MQELSWYIAESGKIVNNWSGFTFTYRRLTSRFDIVNYQALSTVPRNTSMPWPPPTPTTNPPSADS